MRMERTVPDAYFAGAITSTFRFSQSNGIPKDASTSKIVYGRSCGMGWRFGIGCSIEAGQIMLSIYFDPYMMDPGFAKTPLTVSIMPSVDEIGVDTAARSFNDHPSPSAIPNPVSSPVFPDTSDELDDWFHSGSKKKKVLDKAVSSAVPAKGMNPLTFS
jgi:hypothetical protein